MNVPTQSGSSYCPKFLLVYSTHTHIHTQNCRSHILHSKPACFILEKPWKQFPYLKKPWRNHWNNVVSNKLSRNPGKKCHASRNPGEISEIMSPKNWAEIYKSWRNPLNDQATWKPSTRIQYRSLHISRISSYNSYLFFNSFDTRWFSVSRSRR